MREVSRSNPRRWWPWIGAEGFDEEPLADLDSEAIDFGALPAEAINPSTLPPAAR